MAVRKVKLLFWLIHLNSSKLINISEKNSSSNRRYCHVHKSVYTSPFVDSWYFLFRFFFFFIIYYSAIHTTTGPQELYNIIGRRDCWVSGKTLASLNHKSIFVFLFRTHPVDNDSQMCCLICRRTVASTQEVHTVNPRVSVELAAAVKQPGQRESWWAGHHCVISITVNVAVP